VKVEFISNDEHIDSQLYRLIANGVLGNNRCLFWGPCEIHNCHVWGK